MDETPAQRKAFDDKTRADMLTKFEEGDDRFGNEWADVKTGPALEKVDPDKHIVPVFQDRAKRACLAKQGFEDFFRKQMTDIYDGTVPESIGRDLTRKALDTCWRDLASDIFGEQAEGLEDLVVKITAEVVKRYVPNASPADSHGPHEDGTVTTSIEVEVKEEISEDTIVVRSRAPASIAHVSQSAQTMQVVRRPQRPQRIRSRSLPLRDYAPTNPVDHGADIFKPSIPPGPEPYSEGERPAKSVVQQFEQWKELNGKPLDPDLVNGTKYGNEGWDIDRRRGRCKDWQVHPEFKGNEELLDFGSDDDEE